MPRSIHAPLVVALATLAALCIHSTGIAQNTIAIKPNGFKVSENSPLSSLSAKDNSVTPASFLQGKAQNNQVPAASGSGVPIPSILTGKKTARPVAKPAGKKPTARQDEIDPLNIPAKPIQPRGGFQTPSSFTPPVRTPASTGAATSGFQPRSSAPRVNPPLGGQPAATPRVAALPNATGKKKGNLSSKATTTPPQRSAVPDLPALPKVEDTNNPAPTVEKNVGSTLPRVASNRSPEAPQPINRNKTPVAAERFSDQQLSPQIKVLATGPRSISVNKTGKFDVRVVNTGATDANDIMVGIEIPSWVEVIGKPSTAGGEAVVKELNEARGIVWSLSYLPAGRDALISVNLEPKENRPFSLKTEWTTAPVSGESQVSVTQADLQTRISGPAEVMYGQKAVYTITIENSGNGMAEKVAVSISESLGGDSAAVGLIPAGTTKQFEVELTAGQAGPMKLEAFVKADAGVESEIAKEITVRRAKLAVKAKGPKFKYAGSALTYNLSVENQGDAAARNITAAALLPLNAEYISGLSRITQNDGRKVGWTIPEIPAGSKRDFIITCLVKEAGEARMEIGVRSDDGLTSGSIVTTQVEALADLKLEVVDPRGPQAVGREVTYELHIKNRGTKSARNVKVSGEFSDFIDPVAGSGAKASKEKGGIISFEPISQIKVGESIVIKVVAKAFQPGTHTFRAIVECEEQDIRKISEGTTKFFGEQAESATQKSPNQVPATSQKAIPSNRTGGAKVDANSRGTSTPRASVAQSSGRENLPAASSGLPSGQAVKTGRTSAPPSPSPSGFHPPANGFQAGN